MRVFLIGLLCFAASVAAQPVITPSLSDSSAASSAPSYSTTGTAGSGYIGLIPQSSAPSAPSTGLRLYADSTGRLSWIRPSDGFTRTFDATLTANRVWTMPDASATLVYQGGPLGAPSSGTLTSATGLPLTTGITGTLGVANGGTGLTAGTSGGTPYYSATGTLASSGLLGSGQLVAGGGAGAAPTTSSDLTFVGGVLKSAYEFRLSASYNRIGVVDSGGGFFGGYNVKGSAQPAATMQHDSTGTAAAYYFDANGFTIYTDASAAAGTNITTSRFQVLNAGRILMGVTLPTDDTTTPVQINGAVKASGALLLPGLATSSAATTGTMCWTTSTGNVNVDTTTTCLLSSAKYKQSERALDAGLSSVMRLRPVAYQLRPEFNPTGLGEQLGFFAEDVAKVDSRLVSFDDEGPHAVRYQQMMALAIKAIQEQQEQLNALRAQVHKQQAMIDALPSFPARSLNVEYSMKRAAH